MHRADAEKILAAELAAINGGPPSPIRTNYLRGICLAAALAAAVTTGNTHAPCVIIGERIAEMRRGDEKEMSTWSYNQSSDEGKDASTARSL